MVLTVAVSHIRLLGVPIDFFPSAAQVQVSGWQGLMSLISVPAPALHTVGP